MHTNGTIKIMRQVKEEKKLKKVITVGLAIALSIMALF
jgi:hypothetical protein